MATRQRIAPRLPRDATVQPIGACGLKGLPSHHFVSREALTDPRALPAGPGGTAYRPRKRMAVVLSIASRAG
jgi:hypothetical protein